MSSYPSLSLRANPEADLPGLQVGSSVIVAVPVAALSSPVRLARAGEARSALVVTGAEKIASGQAVAWCKVVLVAPAVVRRDGRVQVTGRPADHARLGALEVELDARCGPGTIDALAAGVRLRPGAKVKARIRREMSVALAIRCVLAMTLMPEADTREVMALLLGDLIDLPWRRAHAVPSSTVLSTWRAAIGAEPLQQLQRMLLEAVTGEHRDLDLRGAGQVGPGIEVGGGLRLGSIDGSLTRMPDTPDNRAVFGTGAAEGSGYPQVRHLHVSDAFTRATLATVAGPAGGDKAEAEQHLLDRVLSERPDVFTRERLWVMDRNFPGVARIAAMLATGTHVLIRLKSDIRLQQVGPVLDDGSYLARLGTGAPVLTLRVIEYAVTLDGAMTEQTFCLVTDLHDHHTHPAHLLAAAYRWRWDGSETALREVKSTITDAGPGTGAILRSHTPELVHQEHAAWMAATELVRATTRSALAVATPFIKGPRTGTRPTPRDLSFTATRHAVIATIRAAAGTWCLPAAARAAAHRACLATIATTRVTVDRHRHRDRKTKTRHAFAAASSPAGTATTPAVIHVYGAPAA